MAKHELTDMEITEISLVDEPANDDARVVIVKAKGGFKPCADCKTPDVCKSKGCEEADPNEAEPDGDPDDKGKMKKTKASMSSVAAALLSAISELAPQIVEKALHAEGYSANSDAANMAEAIIKETLMDIETLSKALEDAEVKIDTLTKRAETAEADLKVAKETITKSKPALTPEEEEAELLKSLPESVRKRLADADAKAKEAVEKAAKLAADAEEKEAIEKAKAMKVAEPEKIGPMLLRIAKGKSTPEDAKAIEVVLKREAAILEKAPMFKSLGTAAAVEGDPEELLKAKAVEIQNAEKVTYAVAYDKALNQNPELYDAYIAKRRTVAAPASA